MKQCRTDCIHAEACRRYADNSTYWQNGDCSIYKPASNFVECIHITKDMIKGHCDPVGEQGEDGLLHIKQEVAREIFEKIEKDGKYVISFVENHKAYSEEVRQAKLECYKDIQNYIAELKKKYTKSEGEK